MLHFQPRSSLVINLYHYCLPISGVIQASSDGKVELKPTDIELSIVNETDSGPSLTAESGSNIPNDGATKYQCLECNFSCASHSILRRHASVAHAVQDSTVDGQMKTPAVKIYKCTHCDYKSHRKHQTKNHMEIHKGDSLFQCGLCTFACRSQKRLSYHYSFHKRGLGAIQQYICTACSYVTKHKSMLTLHNKVKHFIPMHQTFTRSHLKGKYKHLVSTLSYAQRHKSVLRCSYCAFETENKSKMSEHSNSHTSGESKAYQCTVCMYSTDEHYRYKNHIAVHSEQRPYKCSLCTFTAKIKNVLNMHIKKVHSSDRTLLQCPLCPHKTARQRVLTEHYKAKHGRTRLYSCDVCDYKTPVKYNLGVHADIHNNERPYKCSECAYTAKSKNTFKTHMKIHKRDGKVYKCPKCEYISHKKANVDQHMKVHDEKRDYECSLCEFTTKSMPELVSHKRKNHDNLLFHCMECDFKGKSKGGLTMHMRKKHQAHLSTNNEKQKLLSCNQCSFTCATFRGLSHHISLMHVNKDAKHVFNKYSCKHCDYTTRQFPYLEKHVVKEHCCPHCDYIGQTWVLKHHVRTHGAVKERSLKCTYCDYKTSYSLALKVHICTHTGEKSPLCPQ